MCLSGFGAPTACAADAAPVVPLKQLPAPSLAQEVMPLAQEEVRAVVLGVGLWTMLTQVPPILFWTEAPEGSTVIRNGYRTTAGSAELRQGVRVLQACTPVASSWEIRTGHLPVTASYCTDAATPGFVDKLRTTFISSNANSTHSCRQVRLLMMGVIGAVGAPGTGRAAPVPHVSHQEPLSGHQQQTVLAVNGTAASSHPCVPYSSVSSTPTTSSHHSLLLIQQQTEFLQLLVLTNYLLLSELQLFEFL